MNILIDWDHTFTAIPDEMSAFVSLLQAAGHECYVVTARAPEDSKDDPIEPPDDVQVIYTSHKAKIPYCRDELGIEFDLFIEDNPMALFLDSQTRHDIVGPK